MSTGADVPLVPGELRGYRQFLVLRDGLYPVVHWTAGAWAAEGHVAQCSTGAEHEAPARDCTCGLYGWYDPSGTAGAYGGATAVVAVSGRVVLGDRGFRAARGRVEAVALPVTVRWQPRGAGRARRMLAERYPGVQVYSSVRSMVRDHPPHDVRALGIAPVDRAPMWCRRGALALWGLFVLAGYGILLLPRATVADVARTWWPLLLLGLIAWQVALVALVVRSQPGSAHRETGGGTGGGAESGGLEPGGVRTGGAGTGALESGGSRTGDLESEGLGTGGAGAVGPGTGGTGTGGPGAGGPAAGAPEIGGTGKGGGAGSPGADREVPRPDV